MPFSTFTKVGSLYRTTLKQGIASNASALEFNDTPLANIEYPNWFVIEPNSSNYEIIYCPTAPTGAAFTGVVRGINPGADVDTTDVAFQKGHAANVEVVLAPLHRQWNQLVDVMDGNSGTGGVNLRIGKDADDDIKIIAQNADVNKPFLIYDKTLNKWLISNDGVSTYDPSSGGSGLIAGLGTTINASAIDLDLRTSGGLRNNQGVGSKQADVDPTIVARLDTANTWAAVQSVAADNLQITTDANSANDGVRSSYLDSTLDARLTAAQATAVKSGPASDASEYHFHRPSHFTTDMPPTSATITDNTNVYWQGASNPDGSKIVAVWKQAAANQSKYGRVFSRDTTGNYYTSTAVSNFNNTGSSSSGQYASVAMGTTYIWIASLNSGGTDILITRYASDLTGAQVMTISGTANTDIGHMCGNDSVLYVGKTGATATVAVYTISGTTATRGADITLGDTGATRVGMWFDGTDIIYATASAIKRYTTAGSLVNSLTRTYVTGSITTGRFAFGFAYRSTADIFLLVMNSDSETTNPTGDLEGIAVDLP